MTLAYATFTAEGDGAGSTFEPLTVHFNPASLKVTFSNTIADGSGTAHQASAKSASKLEMELIFDSSETGEDVRTHSNKLRGMGVVKEANKKLSKVTFAWGTFSFVGSIESLNETIDFFSAEGTPLRITIQVSLKGLKLDEVKEQQANSGNTAANGKTATSPLNGLGATGLAQSVGDPRAGRALATANGLESMRFPGTDVLSLGSGDVALKGPAGLSAELSVGTSLDVSGSLSAFAGLGESKGATATFKLEMPVRLPKLDAFTNGAQQFDLTGKLVSAASGRVPGQP